MSETDISATERVLKLIIISKLFSDIEHVAKYSRAAILTLHNFEIILGKFLPWLHMK